MSADAGDVKMGEEEGDVKALLGEGDAGEEEELGMDDFDLDETEEEREEREARERREARKKVSEDGIMRLENTADTYAAHIRASLAVSVSPAEEIQPAVAGAGGGHGQWRRRRRAHEEEG